MPRSIVLCVRWYLGYKLSYGDLVAMMAERVVAIAQTTILASIGAIDCHRRGIIDFGSR